MQLLQEILVWFLVVFYAVTMVTLLPIEIYAFIQDLKRRRLFKKDISEKYSSSVHIDVELIRIISKARGINESVASSVIRSLLADSREKESNDFYLELCEKLEEVTPFYDLPEDARSSLLKLKELIKESDLRYDNHIIEPIIGHLTAYVDLKRSYLRSKKVSLLIYS